MASAKASPRPLAAPAEEVCVTIPNTRAKNRPAAPTGRKRDSDLTHNPLVTWDASRPTNVSETLLSGYIFGKAPLSDPGSP